MGSKKMDLRYRLARKISLSFPEAKKIRTLTSLFDKTLLAYTFVFYHKTYANITAFITIVQDMENGETVNHIFGGKEFKLNKHEICHIHGNGIIDIYWKTEQERDWLITNGYCKPHYIEPDTRWTSFFLEKRNLAEAIRFAKISYNSILHNRSFIDSNSNLDPVFNP